MALFPKCSFKVLVPDGVIVQGERVEGTLVLDAPEAIPRAEHVELRFRSVAWAGYGGGKSRSVVRKVMFEAPLHVELPKDEPLAAGEHRYPFTIDVPRWLPPGYVGSDCGIQHTVETRLDVAWAIDPDANLTPTIGVAAREGTRSGLTARSPVSFHDEIVLELTLASSVFAVGENLEGQIAIRSGHAARFDAIDLTLASSATIRMARSDRRNLALSRIRVPAARLRQGDAVPFSFPSPDALLPSFRTSFIDHDVVLVVSVDIPWAPDPSFEVRLDVLPAGSTLVGASTANIVGSERLRRIAASMAQHTGLKEGTRPPSLVYGEVGPVALAIADAPRDGKLGVYVDITFPDVELGLNMRPLGLLEGFRTSPLLPPALADRYLLRCSPEDARPRTDESALSSFVASIVATMGEVLDVRLSDHHLGVHVPLQRDSEQRLIEIAQAAHAQAKSIGEAIAALPFPAPLAAARPAWQATAAEQGAFLVPTGPTLHGVTFRARVVGGEERVVSATIRTVWKTTTPSIQVELDLHDSPLSDEAAKTLEGEPSGEALRAVHAVFPVTHATAGGKGATLEQAAWTADPRALLSAVETFFWWVLEVRGERRADLPYR